MNNYLINNRRFLQVRNQPLYNEYGIPILSHGGKIYIKPENRGKFNATKARTGKTTKELTHSKNPITRKRAIFAQNAAKWHHKSFGGLLQDELVDNDEFSMGGQIAGNTLGGIASGALQGAALGTAIPIPVLGTVSGLALGTIAGGISGLTKGIFAGKKEREQKKLEEAQRELEEKEAAALAETNRINAMNANIRNVYSDQVDSNTYSNYFKQHGGKLNGSPSNGGNPKEPPIGDVGISTYRDSYGNTGNKLNISKTIPGDEYGTLIVNLQKGIGSDYPLSTGFTIENTFGRNNNGYADVTLGLNRYNNGKFHGYGSGEIGRNFKTKIGDIAGYIGISDNDPKHSIYYRDNSAFFDKGSNVSAYNGIKGDIGLTKNLRLKGGVNVGGIIMPTIDRIIGYKSNNKEPYNPTLNYDLGLTYTVPNFKNIGRNKDIYYSKKNGIYNISKRNRVNRGTGRTVRFLANGGNITNIPDSNAVPIDNNAELALNDNGTPQGFHETGQNIPAYNINGQQVASVEPGEVIMELPDGSKYALSKRLGVAQIYMQLLAVKQKLIDSMSATDTFQKNQLKREIDKIDAKINQLPAYQEHLKQQYGIQDQGNSGQQYATQNPEQTEGIPQYKYGNRLDDGGWLNYAKSPDYTGWLNYRNLFDNEFIRNNQWLFNNQLYNNKLLTDEQLKSFNTFNNQWSSNNRLLKTLSLLNDIPVNNNRSLNNNQNLNNGELPIFNINQSISYKRASNRNGFADYTNQLNNNKSLNFNNEIYKELCRINGLYDNYNLLDNGLSHNLSNSYFRNNNSNSTNQSRNNNNTLNKSKNKSLNSTLNTIGQVADIVVPLTDNIVNYFMTKNTPKIPKPILDKPTIVEDRINVDNQLAAIENNKREAFKAIDEKVSDVAVANAMKREISKNATNSMLEVLNKKEEIERELRDKNASSIAQTNNSNNRLLDAYNMNVATRKFGMKEDYSENLADLTKDYYNYRNRSDLKDAQDIEVQAISKMFDIPVSAYLIGGIPGMLSTLTEDQLAAYYKMKKNQPEYQKLTRKVAEEKGYNLTYFGG